MTAAKISNSTSEAAGVVAHIQSHTEHEKALLARELHDELGGLLVGAMMDLAWAEQHLSAPTVDLKSKLTRARQTLASAIDLKRRLIEELRPTLLDNVGLFAALRWHVQGVCTERALTCEIQVPEEEPKFPADTPIALFRVGQEALALLLADRSVTSIRFSAQMGPQLLTFDITTTAPPIPVDAQLEDASYPLTALRHRVVALGGHFKFAYGENGGIVLKTSFPLA